MKLHPRMVIMAEAALELAKSFTTIVKKYDLTYGEMFGILSDMMSTRAKYMRHDERHPNDPDKGGDEA